MRAVARLKHGSPYRQYGLKRVGVRRTYDNDTNNCSAMQMLLNVSSLHMLPDVKTHDIVINESLFDYDMSKASFIELARDFFTKRLLTDVIRPAIL